MKAEDTYKETLQTWNQLASVYRDRFMNFNLYNETYDALCGELPYGASILELGSGPGVISRYLLEKRPDLQILMTDAAPNMVKMAQEEVPQAKAIVLDARDIETISEQFDALVAGFVLPYISDEDAALWIEKLNHRLHSKGWLYLSFVPGNPSDSGFMEGSNGKRTYFQYHAEAEIDALLKEHGFSLVKKWHLSYLKKEGDEEIHTVILAKK